MSQYQDDNEFEDWGPSKSQLKRDAEALQKMGEEIVSLSHSELEKIPLDEELAEAVELGRKLKPKKDESFRRHLQFIGRLMRSRDIEPIAEALSIIKNRHSTVNARLHRLEQLQQQPLSADDRAAQVRALAAWLCEQLGTEPARPLVLADDLPRCRQQVLQAIEDRFYGEIRRMERMVLLEVLDTAWKDHLLAMDHLRSGIGLVGYAQKDVKVEYKREGMRTFESMWDRIGQQTTDLVLRMRQLDEGFVSSTWAGSQARHDEAAPASQIARQQQAAMQQGAADRKPEPIRNRDDRVGRNDPCPCGSGKKFKQCCMRKQRDVA